jgi:hypothetical protein
VPETHSLAARSLHPLLSDLDAPSGTAVALASLLGVPFVRLRAALPDELLGWDIPTALGRRSSLSKAGMEAMLDEHSKVLPSLFTGVGRRKVSETDASSPKSMEELAQADVGRRNKVLMSLLEEGNADDVEGSETFAGDEHDALMEEVRPCIKIAAVARSLR